MKFNYNKDLEFKERLLKVLSEVKAQYPLINEKSAAIASMMSSPVDDKATNDDKFDRYYFLLKEVSPEDPEYNHIFNDLYNLYEAGFENSIYNNCMEEIINFIEGEREDFPLLSEFYLQN